MPKPPPRFQGGGFKRHSCVGETENTQKHDFSFCWWVVFLVTLLAFDLDQAFISILVHIGKLYDQLRNVTKLYNCFEDSATISIVHRSV